MDLHESETMFQLDDEHWWYVGLRSLIFPTLDRLCDAGGANPG